MSRNINVNPAHYKVAGRERQGENLVQSVERQAFAQQKADTERWREKQTPPAWETTPPAPPVTQEQRDEATAIAQVQGKKQNKKKMAKRAAPRRAAAKRAAPKRAAAKRPAPARRKSSARKMATRRAKAPGRRRAR